MWKIYGTTHCVCCPFEFEIHYFMGNIIHFQDQKWKKFPQIFSPVENMNMLKHTYILIASFIPKIAIAFTFTLTTWRTSTRIGNQSADWLVKLMIHSISFCMVLFVSMSAVQRLNVLTLIRKVNVTSWLNK